MSTKKREYEKECSCNRQRAKSSKGPDKKSPAKSNCSRKRQTFVFNPEEETWAEPYMLSLGKKFSQTSIMCDSKIELPWKEIALNSKEIKIRGDSALKPKSSVLESEVELETTDLEGKESNDKVSLPWKFLVISDVGHMKQASALDLDQCGSKLEIPWDMLAFDKPVQINPVPEEESCKDDEIMEIPWSDLMIPQNLIIEARKIIEHPSNRHPPRSASAGKRRGCPSCIKNRKESRKK